MKKNLVIFFLGVTMISFGQNRNNVWMLCGYGIHNCGIQFISGQVDTFSVYRNMEFFITNASICDTTGELLFYTNGDYIENRNHSRLLNSTNFNPTVTGDTIYG
ncbi:MAG: hypothetical protein NT126_10605, partial [Bacteroidetes bacterium]|nr:hypothetical protein [Bacteroidota bacterium]